MYKFKTKILFLFLFLGLAIPVFFGQLPSDIVYASITNGTIDSVYKYAWSSNAGWLNFGCTNCNILISDTAITGYAWNDNYGWINLAPDGSGVKNNREGTLSGYAWGENTGWINFSGVTISSSGIFSGTASGDTTGTISFNCTGCTITTDWRPVSIRTGGPATASSSPSYPPSGGLSVLINNGQTATNNLAVILTIRAGSDVKKMALSNSPDFAGAILEDFQTTKNWILTQGDGQKTIYVKFYNEQSLSSIPVSASIILDTQRPEVTITRIKSEYSLEEEVILGGTTKPNSQISLSIDGKFGLFTADSQGNWLITLGRKSLGKHLVELIAKDSLENMGNALTVEFSVEEGATTPPALSLPSIIKKIEGGIKLLIPKFLQPPEGDPQKIPEQVITVPKIPPLAMSDIWNIFPTKPIQLFVLSPLPKEINVLAQKFPKLQKTFNEVGILKNTDIEKLRNTKLNLLGISQIFGLAPVEIAPGKFAPLSGIQIADLPSQLKQQIPSGIVFARVGGGLLDVNIILSIDGQGKPQQIIETISGAPLQLAVKVDALVNKVTGYIVFESSRSTQTSFEIPLKALTASLMFAGPDLAQTQTQPVAVEKRLVLSKFEYQNTGDGVYTASIQAPTVVGQYQIITVIDYQEIKTVSEELKLITVVDPEGYIYEKQGNKETRIGGAVASLYWLNSDTKQYELWPAKNFQQENPQITNVSGTYSFLVPEGYYYLKVDAPGYLSYEGAPFQVKEGSGVHTNVQLKTKYWFLNIVDWKTVLLIIVIFLLLYNFYQDKMRVKIAMLVNNSKNKTI